jgi:hypothetical protein
MAKKKSQEKIDNTKENCEEMKNKRDRNVTSVSESKAGSKSQKSED